MNADGMSLTMHEQIEIAASGYFEGYRSNIRIVATNRYGYNHRNRYDAVEVTIPSDAGGPIASSRDLIRPSEDSALAVVLGILTIRYGAKETCLLQVMFLKAAARSQGRRRLTDGFLQRFRHIFYGTPCAEWVALYPLVTLRAPALKIADPERKNCFVLYSCQYLSRGLWESLPTAQEQLTWSSKLPRASHRDEHLEDEQSEQDSSDS